MRHLGLLSILLLAAPAVAAALECVSALPGAPAAVSARLTARDTGSFARILSVTMTSNDDARPITRYDVELGKRLHLIAVSADFRIILHEHAERPDTAGRFAVPMTFPHGGVWHLYADAAPAGLGQQVMRFDLDLGGAPAPAPPDPFPDT